MATTLKKKTAAWKEPKPVRIPLSFEEALGALLQTKPEPKKKKTPATETVRRPRRRR